MKYKLDVTLDKAIAFLRIYLTLACCWPFPANATKLQKLHRSVLRFFCCGNAVVLAVAAIWTIYNHTDDTLILLKLGCQLSAMIQIVLQLVLFSVEDERLQLIMWEIEECYQKGQKEERAIFQNYVDKCKNWYECEFYGRKLHGRRVIGGIIIWLIAAGLNLISGPLFLPQPFPLDTEYPFNVQYQPLKTIILIQHIIIICQSVSQVSANTYPAFILWCVAARFDILSAQFRAATNKKDLIKCTQNHHALLRFAKEVTHSVRYIALSIVTFSTGAVIFGFLTFMSRHPWSVKWTFFMIALGGFIELYMFAWPADNVISTSMNISNAIYESLWFDKDPIIQKFMLHIMLRSQRPVTISVPLALPTLSLSYYTSYISTISSYMAVVRVMMEEK